ncbi:MAG: tRNA (adenosine(37)-N6)-threonylcarbamoyltransferase complex dimerization subunit type 1 TsaB [Saprospiraceae bacterium]|nr:tRNA (adenosine(37)-N6)-threonylcarbamoyltransferase complex dimerization subunit type 1 TsaB [Saprospiraceae bacterium]
MANILNIETSSKTCSVALSKRDKVIASLTAEGTFTHAKELTTLIDDLLKANDLKINDIDAVAVNAGPGSYTALRVGYSVAKGLCFGADLKMLAHSSFEILNSQAKLMDQFSSLDCIVPVVDARRDEVYMIAYDEIGSEIIDAQSFILDEEALKTTIGTKKNILIIGDAAEKSRNYLKGEEFSFKEVAIMAPMMASLSWDKYQSSDLENVAYTIPFYLKPPNIVKSKKKYF